MSILIEPISFKFLLKVPFIYIFLSIFISEIVDSPSCSDFISELSFKNFLSIKWIECIILNSVKVECNDIASVSKEYIFCYFILIKNFFSIDNISLLAIKIYIHF